MGWISENPTGRTIVQLLSPRDGKGAGHGVKGGQHEGEAGDGGLGTGAGGAGAAGDRGLGDRGAEDGGLRTGGLGDRGAGDRAGGAEPLTHHQACPARWQTSRTPESGPALKAGRSGGRGLASETGPGPGW